MEKRLIIAVAMSLLIVVTFQYMNKPQTEKLIAQSENKQTDIAAAPETQSTEVAAVKQMPIRESETLLTNDMLAVTISNIGGGIKDIKIKDYKDQKTKDILNLSSITNPSEYIFATFSTNSIALSGTNSYEIFTYENSVVAKTKSNDLEVIKRYKVEKNSRIISMELEIKNLSSSGKTISYQIIGGAGINGKDDVRFVEVASKINGTVGAMKKSRNQKNINLGICEWIALKNHYFSIIFKPFYNTRSDFVSERNEGDLVVGVESGDLQIPPGASTIHKYILYAGPTKLIDLKTCGYGFEESLNYGFFGFISKFLLFVLNFFYSLVKNWGIAIIMISIFLNILLFPLSNKSFKSIQKMQELHPQMEKLKIQYKDSPQKLNKEIMELYKKYKINPLSGCLPMLLQMPIFFALYQALTKSIELRGASFLWIRDLSGPEALPLPVSFPIIGDTINILPLVMVVAMALQQKMSSRFMGSAVSDEQKQQQKMMLIIMPIMFGFIFYNMPSGLVLYWLINTVLTIVEQSAIFRNS